MKKIVLLSINLLILNLLTYSQETQKSTKTNDTSYSVPIGTIRIYNRLTNEYEKCSETVDSLNSRIKNYKTIIAIDSLIDKNNEQIYKNQELFIQRQAKVISDNIKKEEKKDKKLTLAKGGILVVSLVAILEGIYIGIKSIIQ